MFDFSKLLQLQNKLDSKTLVLLGRFVIRALAERDTNAWVRDHLTAILDGPETRGPIRVTVNQCQPVVRNKKS